jgi:hypothetical protein
MLFYPVLHQRFIMEAPLPLRLYASGADSSVTPSASYALNRRAS